MFAPISRNRVLFCLLLSLLTTSLSCQPSQNHKPLRVTFLDVGQGDSALIECPSGRVVVVDGGGAPDTDEREGGDTGSRIVVPFLRSRGISTIDLLVMTHPHNDHAQGLIAVLERLRVLTALDSGYRNAPEYSRPSERLRDMLRQTHIPVHRPFPGQRIDLGGGAILEVLSPPATFFEIGNSPTNNNSIVLRLVYGHARFLLTGDIESEAEESLLHQSRPISADVLKVGHHGSRWSSTAEFLRAVAPSVAVISCGKNNIFGHPAKETLERLQQQGARIYRTDKQGAITVETDGTTIRVIPTLTPTRSR